MFDTNGKVAERLMRYARIDSQSAHGFSYSPSTAKQRDMGRELAQEMERIGVSNVWFDEEHCVVYGTVPSTLPDGGGMSVGFVSHLDTTPDVTGTNVKPWLLENYQGGDVVLNKEQGIVLKAEEFPRMSLYIGDDLIFSDGTTLLGGDDKSACAIEMTVADYLIQHPEIKHGPVQLAFTPDEEVAGGARDLQFDRFGAEVAYTIDGRGLGGYMCETFNATESVIEIHGRNVHPGSAKGVMINAVEIAAEYCDMLPALDRCQYTEGREGYFHPYYCKGTADYCMIKTLIRDHDEERFLERKRYMEKCVEALREKYGAERIDLHYANSYWSMKKVVDKVPFMIDYLVQAIKDNGVEPECIAMRGGTDGAQLSGRGLPCPNITAGYENGHSRFEFASVQAMAKTVDIIVDLLQIYAEKQPNGKEGK